MQYHKVRQGIFRARPNRFIAHVEMEQQIVVCHVKNTGRCRELLVPGAAVYLEESGNPARKTKYDLVAVKKGARLINMDSQAPNKVFAQWAQAGNFRPGLTKLRPETTYGNSRFDFYWEALPEDQSGAEKAPKGFVEVKGVTLEEDGVVLFPDAPTQRGVKHLEELVQARRAGYQAAVCFVVQMSNVNYFTPNERTHPEFGAALRRAAQAGVEVLAVDCVVEPDQLEIRRAVEVRL